MPRDRRSRVASRYIASSRLLYSCFAFVMATGIVSITAGLADLGPISTLLFGLNLIVFSVLWALLAIRLVCDPRFVLADLSHHNRAPRMLTIVAATCVIGNEIALAGGPPQIVAGFWVVAAALWSALVYGLFAAITLRSEKLPLESSIDGGWLLLVVATEALAILTTRTTGELASPAPALFAGLCLLLLGGAFYGIVLLLIVYRWLFLPMRLEHLTPAYWINMGAAAITTLAAIRVFEASGAVTDAAPLRGFVFAAIILFWSLASWWIPLLAALTLWQRFGRAGGLSHGLDDWSMVFPLGMYTTATWRLSHEIGFPFLRAVPEVFVWVALFAWGVTLLGMLREAISCRIETPG